MTDAAWVFHFSWGGAAAAGVFLAALAWFLAVSLRGKKQGVRFAAAQLLGTLAGLMLIVTLFRPERVRRATRKERPLVAVLMDGSGSMATRDVATNRTVVLERREWLAERVREKFWIPLEEKHAVAQEIFGAVPTNASSAAGRDPGTDLNKALQDAATRYAGLRAVLLLTDGDWNLGKPPVTAATALRQRDIPVFCVAVGSENFLPDLELQSVRAPAYGFVDEHISIPFTVQSRLPRDVSATVELRSPDGQRTTKPVTIPAMSQLCDSILWVPQREGNFDFALEIPPEKDEVFADNNAKTFTMNIRREVLKVLVVESVPRWEYRFIRNALARDPSVSVHCLLYHPGLDRPGEGRDYIPAFPSTRDALSVYDVVFLGDVGVERGMLTAEHAAMLKGLVEQQGSGIVFLPGRNGRQKTLLGSDLGALCPVAVEDSLSGYSGPLEARLELTTRGSDHLLTLLAQDPESNRMVWRYLPGFCWYASVTRAKPGADVLAVHAVARNENGRIPLLVTRTCGNGKALFLGTDSAWRWRRGVEDTFHYRFWGQVVRWMAHQRHLAGQEGIRFFYAPESPRVGERVFLHATVFDKSGFPLEGSRVEATLVSQTGRSEKIELTPERGGWGVFAGYFVPSEGGAYEIAIACEAEGRSAKTRMTVEKPVREKIGRPARAGVLKEIAAVTGGNCGTFAELDDMVRGIRCLPEREPTPERLRLWCHPLWCAGIVALLALHWTGRKLTGQV